MFSSSQAETFRRLSIGEPATVRSYVGAAHDAPAMIDPQYLPLVRLAALVMADSAESLYQREVNRALDAGASFDQVVGVLLAVAPIAGSARVVSAASKIAMALGYDVAEGLAELDGSPDDAH